MEENNPMLGIIDEATQQKLEAQLGIVRTLLLSLGGRGRETLPEIIAYEISRFVFQNPLALKTSLFTLCRNTALLPKLQYLLVRKKSQFQQLQSLHETPQIEAKPSEKAPLYVMQASTCQQSAYLTLTQRWKAVRINNEQNFAQILMKGELLLVFLSSFKLHPLNWKQEQQSLVLEKDFHNYQKRQKQQHKYYHLISDRCEQTFSYLQEVMRYKKEKKINQLVIKSFIGLMRKNMVLVRMDRNYNTGELFCEDKYLYVQNDNQLSLTNRRNLVNSMKCPSLKWEEDNLWKVVENEEEDGFEIYREISFPLSRATNKLLSRKLNVYVQTDAWIEECL